MLAIRRSLALVALVALPACSGEGASSEDTGGEITASSADAVTLLDCQKQVTSCTLAARSFRDLGACTTAFQACGQQAALDLAGASNVLSQCRTKANACLESAVTTLDISACRGVYETCAGNVRGTVKDAVAGAVEAAEDAIDATLAAAKDAIDAAAGGAGAALDAVATCETEVTTCLKSATTTGAVSTCRTSFEACVDGVVSALDDVVAPLPGPTPSQIVDSFDACQTSAQACLEKAVTSLDVAACQSTLETCVGGATSLVDATVDDVNAILPVPVPTPGTVVDCNAAAAQCLLKFGNPVTCADQAAACLGL